VVKKNAQNGNDLLISSVWFNRTKGKQKIDTK